MALAPLDPRSTALILIDLQKGILSMPTVPLSGAEVIQNAARLAQACRAVGATVVLVRVAFAPDGADALRPEADEAMVRSNTLPADWSDLVEEIGPREGDLVVTKRQWGAFYGTDLDLQLRRRGIRTILLGGISTNFGVESTARAAYELGYQQIFAVDAMAGRSAEQHDFPVRYIFPRIGRVRTTEEIRKALGA